MKKVLFIITKGNFGGAQRYVFDVATSLPNQAFESIVACGEGETLPNKLNAHNIRVIRLKNIGRDVRLLKDFYAFLELRRLIKKECPDVVHLNSSKIGIMGAVAIRSLNLFGLTKSPTPKIIFTAHGWAFNENRNFVARFVIKVLSWLTVLLSHRTIAVSKKTASDISGWPGISKKIKVVYNGISSINFIEGFKARQELAPDITEGLWIGTIAELHSNKGLDYLIQAYAKIADQLPNSTLVIIGEGEEREHLQKLIQHYSLEKKIRLLGFIPDAAEYLKAFDIFVLPSRTEAFAYVVLEAGLAGLPVIASHVGGLPEVVTPESGKTFPRGKVKALGEALIDLSENEELRLSLGVAIQERVSTLFSLRNMVEETQKVYNESYE
jgi:glycosyltransferase involved in cell wall biosynthesis